MYGNRKGLFHTRKEKRFNASTHFLRGIGMAGRRYATLLFTTLYHYSIPLAFSSQGLEALAYHFYCSGTPQYPFPVPLERLHGQKREGLYIL